MATPFEILNSAVTIFRALSPIEKHRHQYSGKLCLNAELYESMQLLEKFGNINPVFFDGKPIDFEEISEEFHFGKELELTVTRPNSDKTGYFFWDFDDLISTSNFKYNFPDTLYVCEWDYLHSVDPAPPKFLIYQQTLVFIDLLCKAADHKEIRPVDCSLFFLSTVKIEMPIQYKSCDLLEIENVNELSEHILSDDAQKDQRFVIFKSALVEMLQYKDAKSCFTFLLKNHMELFRRYKDNYELYVRNFSFEKVKGEIEEKIIEYIQKLNNVMADVQNKLLAIPLALILIGGQLKDSGAFSIQNTVVLFGVLSFVILMTLLILNQEHTLINIDDEINSIQRRFETKYPDIEEKIHASFKKLKHRYFKQYIGLVLICLMVWAIGGVGVYLYDKYTPEIIIFPFFELIDNFVDGIGKNP